MSDNQSERRFRGTYHGHHGHPSENGTEEEDNIAVTEDKLHWIYRAVQVYRDTPPTMKFAAVAAVIAGRAFTLYYN